jgi:hypothetical protein
MAMEADELQMLSHPRCSSELVNAIVAGECPIDPAQAQLLADRFKVSASLFG